MKTIRITVEVVSENEMVKQKVEVELLLLLESSCSDRAAA